MSILKVFGTVISVGCRLISSTPTGRGRRREIPSLTWIAGPPPFPRRSALLGEVVEHHTVLLRFHPWILMGKGH